jgi:hypothetical protein
MNTRTTNRLFKQLDETVTDLKAAFEHFKQYGPRHRGQALRHR